MTEPDTTTMTGAQFREHVGTDPAKWAEAYLAAYDHEDVAGQGAAERLRYTCAWFRDAMDAAAARAKWDTLGDCLTRIDTLVRHDEEPQCPPTP